MDSSDNPTVDGLTRAMPENQQETERDPQRPYASHLVERDEEMVRSLRRRKEVGRNDRPAFSRKEEVTSNRDQRNSLSGSWKLPLERAISRANPANNGEALTSNEVGNPVGSRERLLFDPVTTEAKAKMELLVDFDKSMDSIRRRPSSSRIDIPSYISGYVDGEGCFCVSMRPQPRIRVGWEVRPSFSVSQNGDRAELIKLLPKVFGGGSIRPDRSDQTLKFEIRSLSLLLSSVIPFFETYPLLSAKRKDFELFRTISFLMSERTHLNPEGIVQIAKLAQEMNSGVRKYTAEFVIATVQR